MLFWQRTRTKLRTEKRTNNFLPKHSYHTNLIGEGNYYHDIRNCGIGYHGDTERKIVVGCRLGASMPLHYNWYHKRKPVGKNVQIPLHHGDIYIMDAKAVGYDWKSQNIYTLRHATGCSKYTKIKEK